MDKLNANIFQFADVYKDNMFEFILGRIVKCYHMMLDKYDSIENNENKIKNRLYKDFLNNQNIRASLNLNSYLFKTETATIDDNYNEKGYYDIEVIDLIRSLKSVTANYIIECKRIDGSKGLNDCYYSEGILRFVDEKYPTHSNVNGMIAFVVKKIDIDKNRKKIPSLDKYEFIDGFNYSYVSLHEKAASNVKFRLYHLMLDFSDKMN